MASYLDLCNRVIQESANELDELTLDNWDAPEAGRRLYPRIKRMVAEAWKTLQMERDEWEFGSKELNTTLYPRIKINSGARALGDVTPGMRFRGDDSGFEFTVRDSLSSGWDSGDAAGQLDMQDIEGSNIIPGESFTEISPDPGNGTFVYEQKGSYDLRQIDSLIRSIRYESVVTYKYGESPSPCIYIPWNNWTYKELEYIKGSASLPVYYSEDFEGSLVFYPQTLDPFNVSLVYDTAPQQFTDPEDEPALLDEEYHDWIAWRALENIAQYDKNPTLFAYANRWANFYKSRADKALMPTPRWGMSRYEAY